MRLCPVSFYGASFLLAASACAAPRAIRRFEASRPCASIACCRWSISPLACDHPGTVYRMHLHSIVGIPCAPSRCGYQIIARSLEAPSAPPQGTCSRCLDGDHPAPSCAADRVLSDSLAVRSDVKHIRAFRARATGKGRPRRQCMPPAPELGLPFETHV